MFFFSSIKLERGTDDGADGDGDESPDDDFDLGGAAGFEDALVELNRYLKNIFKNMKDNA